MSLLNLMTFAVLQNLLQLNPNFYHGELMVIKVFKIFIIKGISSYEVILSIF